MVKLNKSTKKWSKAVTQNSHALTLEEGIFTANDPKKIARSLKLSAMKSKNRKSTPLQSSMSMLNFFINRAGKHLDKHQRQVLEQAKIELRKLFNSE